MKKVFIVISILAGLGLGYIVWALRDAPILGLVFGIFGGIQTWRFLSLKD